MQLGRTIIGAIIGAALGIAVMAAIYLAFKLDSAWLALPVAVLTGLGVRMMVSTSGHASYLRGAITGLLALGAYLLGWSVMATYAQQTASQASKSTRVEQPAEPGDKAEADEGAKADDAAAPAEIPKAPDTPAASRPTRGANAGVPKGFSPLDYIVLCAAGLIAYELGRGTAGKPAVAAEETGTEVPAGTHPDA